jgi:exosortase A
MAVQPRLDHIEPAPEATAEVPAMPKRPAWPVALAALGAAWLGILAAFWPSAASMVNVWSNTTAFGHGFLIVPAALYLAWDRRERIAPLAPTPAPLALIGLLLAALATFAATVAGVDFIAHVALVVALQGAVFAVLGWRVAWALLFPLAYLFFAVPFGTFLIIPLQDITADLTVTLLRLSGIPVYVEGYFLTIPNGRFEVAEACSGIKFLIASVAVGAYFTNLFLVSWRRRLAFIAIFTIVPILANGLRAYSVVLMGYLSDMTFGVGPEHITVGWVLFAVILCGVLLIGWWIREPVPPFAPPPPERERKPAGASRFLTIALGAAAIAALSPAASSWLVPRGTPEATPVLADIPIGEAWHPVAMAGPAWNPAFRGADAERLEAFEDGRGRVEVYVGYYAWQRPDAELITYDNLVYDDEIWKRAGDQGVRATIDGAPMMVTRFDLIGAGHRRMVWVWYWVDGRFTADRRLAKALNLAAILTGGERRAAVIALAADYEDDPAEAGEALARFAADLGPVGAWLGATR